MTWFYGLLSLQIQVILHSFNIRYQLRNKQHISVCFLNLLTFVLSVIKYCWAKSELNVWRAQCHMYVKVKVKSFSSVLGSQPECI